LHPLQETGKHLHHMQATSLTSPNHVADFIKRKNLALLAASMNTFRLGLSLDARS